MDRELAPDILLTKLPEKLALSFSNSVIVILRKGRYQNTVIWGTLRGIDIRLADSYFYRTESDNQSRVTLPCPALHPILQELLKLKPVFIVSDNVTQRRFITCKRVSIKWLTIKEDLNQFSLFGIRPYDCHLQRLRLVSCFLIVAHLNTLLK